ncbi:MAG: SigF/SigG family RNA polymerase sporulation sigma factor [Lachnospiraceae bacterium]|nr:SigF/SigG family RNA polymerase sporulation sigma factor [Lachnospiraceae bacterium]
MEEVNALIAKAQQGSQEARELLVEKNLGLVHHIVKRFLGRGYDAEDLFQIGSIGLLKSIDKFDLSYDVKFSTYAVPMITGEIKRFLRDDGMVKVSRTIKENGWKIRQAQERIAGEKGRDATLQEIAEETGMSREDIVLALEAGAEVESIHRPVYQPDGSEVYLVDRLPENRNENEMLLNHLMLESLFEELTEKERQLIHLRYFEDKTQMQVARELGITQVQVSRLEKKILLRMRAKIS